MVTGKADLVVKNHGGAAVLRIRVPLRQGIRLRRALELRFPFALQGAR